MPFMLDDLSSAPGAGTDTFVRTINLAGRRGPLARFVAAGGPGKQVPFGWQATAGDILTLRNGRPGERRATLAGRLPIRHRRSEQQNGIMDNYYPGM